MVYCTTMSYARLDDFPGGTGLISSSHCRNINYQTSWKQITQLHVSSNFIQVHLTRHCCFILFPTGWSCVLAATDVGRLTSPFNNGSSTFSPPLSISTSLSSPSSTPFSLSSHSQITLTLKTTLTPWIHSLPFHPLLNLSPKRCSSASAIGFKVLPRLFLQVFLKFMTNSMTYRMTWPTNQPITL